MELVPDDLSDQEVDDFVAVYEKAFQNKGDFCQSKLMPICNATLQRLKPVLPGAVSTAITTSSLTLLMKMFELSDDRLLTEQEDAQGRTPLMQAMLGGYTDIMQLLLDKGAQVNATDRESMTAMHHAVRKSREVGARLVHKYGVDLGMRDNYGLTAVQRGSPSNPVVTFLKQQMPQGNVGFCDGRERQCVESSSQSIQINIGRRSAAQSTQRLIRAVQSGLNPIVGDISWLEPNIPSYIGEARCLLTHPIPQSATLPISFIQVLFEGRDQGWASDEFFGERPDGSFRSECFWAIAIVRDGDEVLRRQLARARIRTDTFHSSPALGILMRQKTRMAYSGKHRDHGRSRVISYLLYNLEISSRCLLWPEVSTGYA